MRKNKLREAIFKQLVNRKSELGDSGENVSIGTKVKVLKDVTIIRLLSNFKILFGFAEQDIVVYSKEEIEPIKSMNVKLLKYGNKTIKIPFVIFEIKTGRDPVSHGLITYSHIAMEIKDKFPFVMYNLVLKKRTMQDKTFWRQGKHFDRIFFASEQTNMIDEMIRITSDHLTHLQKIHVIS